MKNDAKCAVQQDQVEGNHQPNDGLPTKARLTHPFDKRIHGGKGTARFGIQRTLKSQMVRASSMSSRPQTQRLLATTTYPQLGTRRSIQRHGPR